MSQELIKKANEAIQKCKAAYVGVIDEAGFPSVSTISTIKPESINEVYFSTGMDGNKIKRLQKNNKISICFHSSGDNVTLVGEAEILTDQESKDRFWLDWFDEIYKGGKTDPNYCIVKITPKRASLWVGWESAEIDL